MDIRKLMLNANDSGSNEYKEGWNNAICWMNDNYCITKRNGEAITIQFELTLSASEILEQGLKNETGKNKSN